MSRPIETPLPKSASKAEDESTQPNEIAAAETSSGALPADVAHAAEPLADKGDPSAADVAHAAKPPAAPAHAAEQPTSGASPATSSNEAPAAPPAGKVDKARLEQLIIDALHTIYDPEIPVDIYELGLIYSVEIDDDSKVAITMTLTTPACPVAGSMPGQVEKTVRMIEGVTDVVVDLVWEPTWGPAMMTESARLQLNMY
jgi:FeS assembly SUF system protein